MTEPDVVSSFNHIWVNKVCPTLYSCLRRNPQKSFLIMYNEMKMKSISPGDPIILADLRLRTLYRERRANNVSEREIKTAHQVDGAGIAARSRSLGQIRRVRTRQSSSLYRKSSNKPPPHARLLNDVEEDGQQEGRLLEDLR